MTLEITSLDRESLRFCLQSLLYLDLRMADLRLIPNILATVTLFLHFFKVLLKDFRMSIDLLLPSLISLDSWFVPVTISSTAWRSFLDDLILCFPKRSSFFLGVADSTKSATVSAYNPGLLLQIDDKSGDDFKGVRIEDCWLVFPCDIFLFHVFLSRSFSLTAWLFLGDSVALCFLLYSRWYNLYDKPLFHLLHYLILE